MSNLQAIDCSVLLSCQALSGTEMPSSILCQHQTQTPPATGPPKGSAESVAPPSHANDDANQRWREQYTCSRGSNPTTG